MTLVNHDTGEIVDLDRSAAERRAERIRLRLDAIADNYAAVMPMIREAIDKRDDLALGYRSVGEYVADRFGGALQRLDSDVRRAVVGELTAAGMSTRAIAPVVGVSDITVRRDRRAGATYVAPDPTPGRAAEEANAGSGNTSAEVEARRGTEGDADDAPADIQPEVDPSPARPPVVGIDGKTYSAPPRPRQEQRPDAERMLNTLVMHADKAAREAQKLTAEQIRRVTPKADLWTVDLRNSLEVLQDLLTSLTKEK